MARRIRIRAKGYEHTLAEPKPDPVNTPSIVFEYPESCFRVLRKMPCQDGDWQVTVYPDTLLEPEIKARLMRVIDDCMGLGAEMRLFGQYLRVTHFSLAGTRNGYITFYVNKRPLFREKTQ